MIILKSSCFPMNFLVLNLALACVDGALAFIALFQLTRIHMLNQQIGWTHQKVLHLLIGSCNMGYFIHFITTLIATCNRWLCWSHACGFILMAFPEILFFASFSLLLSFWVDLCHQANEEDDDEESSPNQPLLENSKSKAASSNSDGRRRCCSLWGIHVGSRQKFVIVVGLLIFLFMVLFAVIIWIEAGKNPIDSSTVAQVYVDLFAMAMIILGGALSYYGLLLFLKLRKVRSERASSEMWKVAGLAIVSVVCFTLSALVAFLTDIPLYYRWNQQKINGAKAIFLLALYYFVGSSVPSAFVLWVTRELPTPTIVNRQPQGRTIFFINYGVERVQRNHYWARARSSKNQVLRASPI